MMNRTEVYLSLGSNSGRRKENILEAARLLDTAMGSEHRISKIVETVPWGGAEGGNFLNCVLRYDIPEAGQDAELYCRSLLAVCKDIESGLGRTQGALTDKEGRRIYRARTIDIDILLYGHETIETEILKIPHPLMFKRDFVMVPLVGVLSERTEKWIKSVLSQDLKYR